MSAAQGGSGVQAGLEVLDEARAHLQKVFIAFALTLVITVWGMRAAVWDFLKTNTRSELNAIANQELDIIARTPFDVILLQVKIGLIMAGIVAILLLLWYGRGAMLRRGAPLSLPLSARWRYTIGAVSVVLGVGGVIYAYAVFFPFMFEFLVGNILLSGVQPQFDIVMWTQFLALLTISFGLAAQIPLFMTVFSYTEVITYEFFRDKWKYAVVGIFGFGALFSPPDPFTQIMWAVPLIMLYFFSLALAKLAANLSRAEAATDPAVRRSLRRKTILTLVTGGVTAVIGAVGARLDALAWFDRTVLSELPSDVRPRGEVSLDPYLPLEGVLGEITFGLIVGILVIGLIALFYAIQVLRQPIPPSKHAMMTGDPTELDLQPLDAEGLRAAPLEAFAMLDEDEAVAIASEAIEAGNSEKAEVMLDRFDEAQAAVDAEEIATGEDEGSFVRDRATGVVDAFTDEETTEDDIGGYWHDIVFIYESLTSRMFRILLVFIGVMFGVFYWLYSGGIGTIQEDFLSRMPADAGPVGDVSWPVALHPVEVLLFNVKISAIIGIVVTLPVVLYYAWPALRERGFVSGGRRVLFTWGILVLGGLLAGIYLGYSFIAPPVISGLVFHALDTGMVVAYRLKSFAWLIVYTTIGIGLLFNLLLTMVVFHFGGIMSYQRMRQHWRGFVIGVLIIGSLLTSSSVLTMFLITIPIIVTFGLGLGLLWLLTLPSRRTGPPGTSTAG